MRKKLIKTPVSRPKLFKSVHKTSFHKLKPFIGSCYNLHSLYGNSKSTIRLKNNLVNPDVHRLSTETSCFSMKNVNFQW